MATGKVTKRAVDALTAGARDAFLWDDDLSGFGLKVTPSGGKVYLIQYRMGGRGTKTKRYTIGTHGSPWTSALAREEAERLLQKVRQGIDPADEKTERMRVAVELAFNGYAGLFLKLYVKPHWKGSYAFAEGILRLHIIPAWKAKPLPSLRKIDVVALFDQVPSKQAALRRNIYAVLRRLLNWAKGRGDIDVNPLDGFEAPPVPQARDRVLDDTELRLVWIAAGNIGYPFGAFYRLLILTGQRREEVGGLDWREVNRAAAEWKLPAERAKNGIASTVHLSASTIAELDEIAGNEKWPRRGPVFSTKEDTSISGYSRAKRRLDKAIAELTKETTEAGEETSPGIAAWRTHDLRRTLATGFQRLGVRFEVVEAVLNHQSGSRSGVAGIYQRHDWKNEKRAALDAWADHVRQIMTAADETNVITLADRRA